MNTLTKPAPQTKQPEAATPPPGSSREGELKHVRSPYPGLTPKRLAKLACILAMDGKSKDPNDLVKRAVEVWNAANARLGVKQAETIQEKLKAAGLATQGSISFDEVLEHRLIRKQRLRKEAKSEPYLSSKRGLKEALIGYIDELDLAVAEALQGDHAPHALGATVAQRHSTDLTTLRDRLSLFRSTVTSNRRTLKRIPERVLLHFARYQEDDGSFSDEALSPELLKELSAALSADGGELEPKRRVTF